RHGGPRQPPVHRVGPRLPDPAPPRPGRDPHRPPLPRAPLLDVLDRRAGRRRPQPPTLSGRDAMTVRRGVTAETRRHYLDLAARMTREDAPEQRLATILDAAGRIPPASRSTCTASRPSSGCGPAAPPCWPTPTPSTQRRASSPTTMPTFHHLA